MVLLLWLYNSAQIFVLGAAFNAQIESEETGHPAPGQACPCRLPTGVVISQPDSATP